MKAYIIYKDNYPWDVRVEKIANSMIKLGYDTHIIANNTTNLGTTEREGDIPVIRIPKLALLPKKLSKALKLPIWFNPIWANTLYENIDKNSLIIVRDLPLLKLGIKISKIKGCKLIYDMAEVYPEMYQSMADLRKQNPLERILKNPSLAQSYENNTVRKVDHIFTMIAESSNRLINRGVDPNKISVVSNTPPLPIDGLSSKRHAGTALNIIYVGFLTELRGLDILINGILEYRRRKINKGELPEIKLNIVGEGGAKGALEALVAQNNLQDHITIHGWLSHSEVRKLFVDSNVGALTYRICGHWNHTIPNKIFDYMAAGVPVVSTAVTPIKRIINETNCGVVSESIEPHSISDSLMKLEDPIYREMLGRNGQVAVSEKYNWCNEQLVIKEVLERILTEK